MPTVRILRSAGPNGRCSLSVGGSSFIAKEHYYVFRSAANGGADNKFDYYGGVLAHQNNRNSNYLFQHNQRYFHSNQFPAGYSQNGGVYSAGGVHISVSSSWFCASWLMTMTG